MEIIDFSSGLNKKIILGLGFFDAVHIGHAALLRHAAVLAKEKGVASGAFTFNNNPLSFLGGQKQVLTFPERLTIFEKLGLDYVVAAEMNENMLALSAQDFLDRLTNLYDLEAVVAGADYTFGKDAAGNVIFLEQYLKKKGIEFVLFDFVNENINRREKISTSKIRSAIEKGEVGYANSLLSEPYFILGEVIHTKGRGRRLGFPTANIALDAEKLKLKSGVYLTVTEINGKTYRSLTNVGDRPTFGEELFLAETYILNFSNDIYGKSIKLSFIKRLRDTIKFGSEEAFLRQLKADIKEAEEAF
jgi:riboflavin kinase/FMN adenylyltransferase